MNAFATIARLTATPFSVDTTGRRTQRAVLFTSLLLAICALALTASFATSASAAPDGPPIIVNDEPTPDVHDPPIDDKAPPPSPEPTAEPLDDKAPPPSPEPDPTPDPIDDEIIPAPDEDPGQPATLIIYAYLCDNEVHTEGTCLPANAEFRLASATGEGDPLFFAVGDDGVWSMDLPDGGYWELTEMNADPCWIQSADFTEGGTLPTTAGHETVVEVFNCIGTPDDDPNNPGDEPGDPVITTLPDTGSGPLTTNSNLTALTTISLVLAGLAILGAACHRTMTRKEATR